MALLGVLLALVACTPPPAALPLTGRSYRAAVARTREVPAGAAARDRAWLALLYRGATLARPDPLAEALALAQDVRAGDPRAVLAHAVALRASGRWSQEAAAWVAVLDVCVHSADPACEGGRRLALARLARLDEIGLGPPRAIVARAAVHADPVVRARALRLLEGAAVRRGDAVEVRRIAVARGCAPGTWRVSGPVGRHPHVDLALPPAGAWGAADARGCRVQLRSSRARGGVYHLRAVVEVRGPIVLAVRTRAPWRLEVDRSVTWSTAGARGADARQSYLALPLPPGRHELLLAVGAPRSYADLQLSLLARDPSLGPVAPAKGPVTANGGATTEARPLGCGVSPTPGIAAPPWPRWYAPLADYLAAREAFACGRSQGAHVYVSRLLRLAPAFPLGPTLRALLHLRDPDLPAEQRRDGALGVLSAQAAQHPGLGAVRYRRALLLLELGRTRAALSALRSGRRRWRDEHMWLLGLHRAYRELGYSAEEERVLRQATAMNPRDCAALRDLAAVQQQRRADAAASTTVARFAGCDAGADGRARWLAERGQRARAIGEYRRLLGLRPGELRLQRRLAGLLAVGRGEALRARRLYRRIVARSPDSAEDRISLADLLLAAGDRARATELLADGFRRAPWRQELRRALERVTGRSVMQAYRVDGMDVIARRQSQARTHEAPAVVLQDRTVTRFFASGARISLTHNIIQVLTKEGIERWGEIHIPDGAAVLRLRAIKKDGRSREPEQILGKDSISIPDLQVGDHVEIELLDAASPPAAFEGAMGRRFYFRSFLVPMVSSEYIVIAPPGLELTVDSRGDAPTPSRSTTPDGLRQLRWVALDQPRVVPEPRSIPPDEFISSVRVGAGASWGRWRDLLRERAATALQPGAEGSALARRLTRGLPTAGQRARALYAWVVDNIRSSGPPIASAARAIASGRGSPAAALVSLLREAGVPAQLLLVRPNTAPRLGDTLPDAAPFRAPLVRCRPGGRLIHLAPAGGRWVPFGYVPPILRGARALVVEGRGGQPVTTVPADAGLDRPAGQDSQRLEVTMEVGSDGAVRARAVHRMTGLLAQVWRGLAERLSAEELRQVFERRYLVGHYRGAALQRLELAGAGDRGAQLVLRYRFSASGWCRADAGSLACGMTPLAPRLRREYVGLAERRHPLQLGHHPRTTVVLRLRVPAGRRVVPGGRSVRLRGPFGAVAREVRRSGAREIVVRTRTMVRFRRVSPAQYARFKRFARRVDQLLGQEARVR